MHEYGNISMGVRGGERGISPLDFGNILLNVYLASEFLTIHGYETIKMTLKSSNILKY